MVDVFVEQWVSVVCGMTAHGMCGWFEIFESARHFRIEFEAGRPIRIRIESRSFAGPYLRQTASWTGDRFMVKPFAIGQQTWPTQPSIPQGSVNE